MEIVTVNGSTLKVKVSANGIEIMDAGSVTITRNMLEKLESLFAGNREEEKLIACGRQSKNNWVKRRFVFFLNELRN